MLPTINYCLGVRKLCPSGPSFQSLVFAIFMAAFGIFHQVDAQCVLACRGKGNLSLGPNCEAKILPTMLLTDGIRCPDARYRVDVMDYNMKLLPYSPYVTENEVGMHVTVMVYDSVSKNSCWGKLFIEDKFAPVILCHNDTLYCNDTSFRLPPYFFDYCDANPTIELVNEELLPYTCDPLFVKRVVRSWVATDKYGNKSRVCTDTQWLKRIPIDSVVYPKHFVHSNNCHIECSDTYPVDAKGNPHPDLTGVPTVDGYPLWPDFNLFCNLGTSYEDLVVVDNSCKKKIIRMWRVVEWWCGTAMIRSFPQTIEIVDTKPPHVHCPYDFTVTTNGSYECTSTFYLPPAVVFDSCQDSIHVDVFYGGGILLNQNGGYIKLPIGEHHVTYRAYDACYNLDSCSVKITVEDKNPPTAVCDQGVVVTLTRDDEIHVQAEVFDEGSHDDCHLDSFLVRRMDLGEPCGIKDYQFRQEVVFCCEDAGKKVMVVFRVKDQSGNFNDCMVEVEVQDKTPPVIKCPHDYSIGCNPHLDTVDLSRFGKPDYYDNCIVHMHEYVDTFLNQCGLGYLARNFVIRDNMDRFDTCTQRIYVNPIDSFGEEDIIWPRDTILYVCGADVEPKNLPDGYNFPKFLSVDCSRPGASYEDHVFNYIQDSSLCFKLLRKWKVIDWCQQSYDAQGNVILPHWTHEQIIKVSNKLPPKIGDDCDTIMVCLSGVDCLKERVRISHYGVDDCTPNQLIRSNFKLDLYNNGLIDSTHSEQGNTISWDGDLPVGEHRFIWVFEDQCGNREVCFQIVRVINCKLPTAYCLTGVAINLNGIDVDGDGDVEGVVDVWATDLNRNSYQLCGNPITFSFSRDSSDKFRRYTCDSVGQRRVEMWVTDQYTGLQDFCVSTVIVQDNNKICPGNLTRGNIAGLIQTPYGKPIPESVVLVENLSGTVEAEFDGKYVFPDLLLGYDYQVKVKKERNYLEGISTLDILQIQKHILGSKALGSPWKMLAADVNGDKVITASDMSALRKLILGYDYKFRNSTSWKFIHAMYQFPDPEDPWYQNFPEEYRIQSMAGNMNYVDFVGFKIGDVSQTIWDSIGGIATRTTQPVDLFSGFGSGTNLLNVFTERKQVAQGMQFTLKFDANQNQYVGIKTGKISLQDVHINERFADDGILLVSWTSEDAVTLEPGQVLFSVEFRAELNTSFGQTVRICSDVLQAEMYDPEFKEMDIRWGNKVIQQQDEVVFGIPIPNPFVELTSIPMDVKEEMNYTYKIFDINGALISQQTEHAVKGRNFIKIKRSQMPLAGIYTLRVEASGFAKSFKLVMMNQ
jgi:hypothetical protein